MPCESCNVQFTVFKRKRLCSECRRFYCNHCLVKRNERILCERCIVLTARPLSKIDLLKLKPKDLIFYLQSKHISTTGCVEKEELVNLVLIHINGAASSSQFPSNTTTPQSCNQQFPAEDSENCSNPFDQIKQTCQSLFNSFTDKIIDLNFEAKTSSNATGQQENIYNQPRAQTREIPTYGSSTAARNVSPLNTQSQIQISVPRSSSSKSNLSNANRTSAQCSSSSSPSSPVVSISSISTQSLSSQPPISANPLSSNNPIAGNIPSIHKGNNRRLLENLQDAAASGCECSDDEVLMKFRSRQRIPPENNPSLNVLVEKLSPPSQIDTSFENQMIDPTGSGGISASPSKTYSGGNQKSSEDSSGSSFEELGAVGGASDQEHWQFINKIELQPTVTPSSSTQPTSNDYSNMPSTSSAYATFQLHSSNSNLGEERSQNVHKVRRIIRRRSDGFIHHTPYRSQHDMSVNMQLGEESDDTSIEKLARKRVRKCCKKCGKTKNSLKHKLLKFQQQLESIQMSETEIKQEIADFLNFLEIRAKESFECSDSESNVETTTESDARSSINPSTDMAESSNDRDDDGIHVYALKDDEIGRQWRQDSRFLNLEDFKSNLEFDDLSVKQLKEILMLNRVDFKGCCEKQELLERVNRLWNDLQTSPAVDKLPTDDLCKICMDAPIECVILECGHMATCTNCGKVLSECPICRQYIVRVVRFFRA